MRYTFFLVLVAIINSGFRCFAADLLPPLVNIGLRMSPGIDFSEDPKVREKKPVVIYFANDVQTRYATGFDTNVRSIVNALEYYTTNDTVAHQYLVNLAARILIDLDSYNGAVDRERDSLVRGICEDFRFVSGLAVFRNSGNAALLEDNKWFLRVPWEFCLPENASRSTTRKTLKLPVVHELRYHPMWRAQPLTAPYAIRVALEAVKKEFPEDQFRYILIVKSSSDSNHFLLPWFQGSVEKAKPDAVAESLLKIRESLTEEDGVTLRKGMGIYGPMNDVLRVLAPEPAPLNYLSLPKEHLLEHLATLGGGDPTQGMHFSAFLADGVQGELELSSLPKLKEFAQLGSYEKLNIRNIGFYYSRKGGVSLDPMPIEDLFSLFGVIGNHSKDIQDRFKAWMFKLSKERKP